MKKEKIKTHTFIIPPEADLYEYHINNIQHTVYKKAIRKLAKERKVERENMRIEIEGKPRGQGRPRTAIIAGKPHIYKDLVSREYEQKIANEYKDAGGELYEGAVRLSILASFPVNKSEKKYTKIQMLEDKIAPTKKPDLDNIVKAVMDGLNGVAYKDDSQVVAIDAQKFYGREGRVIVTVMPDGRGDDDDNT